MLDLDRRSMFLDPGECEDLEYLSQKVSLTIYVPAWTELRTRKPTHCNQKNSILMARPIFQFSNNKSYYINDTVRI